MKHTLENPELHINLPVNTRNLIFWIGVSISRFINVNMSLFLLTGHSLCNTMGTMCWHMKWLHWSEMNIHIHFLFYKTILSTIFFLLNEVIFLTMHNANHYGHLNSLLSLSGCGWAQVCKSSGRVKARKSRWAMEVCNCYRPSQSPYTDLQENEIGPPCTQTFFLGCDANRWKKSRVHATWLINYSNFRVSRWEKH